MTLKYEPVSFLAAVCSVFLSLVGLVEPVQAQSSPPLTYEHIYSFQPGDLLSPSGPLVEIGNGVFLGASRSGGTENLGGIYRVTSQGGYTTFYTFGDADGNRVFSSGGLTLAQDGNVYGTNDFGGSSNHGTIFRISLNGVYEVLHNFDNVNGARPNELEAGDGGDFYGTTQAGGIVTLPGTTGPRPGAGTVFRFDAARNLTILYVFHGSLNFGETSPRAGLLRGSDSNFYGSTLTNISSDRFGNVFRMTPDGAYTSQGAFLNGGSPVDKLTETFDGTMYGVYPTGSGGFKNAYGSLFKVPYSSSDGDVHLFDEQSRSPKTLTTGGNGELFITTANKIFRYSFGNGLQLVHDFGPSVSEVHRLLPAGDGNLYGVTVGGGENGLGQIFRVVLAVAEPTPTPVPTPASTATPGSTPVVTPTATIEATATVPVNSSPMSPPQSEGIDSAAPLPTVTIDRAPMILSGSCFARVQRRGIRITCRAQVIDDLSLKTITAQLDRDRVALRPISTNTFQGRLNIPLSTRFIRRVRLVARDGAQNSSVKRLRAIVLRRR